MVIFTLLPTSKSVPTNNFLAIAAPPAVVKVPPLLAEIASVVLVIPIPPAVINDPVLLEVLASLLTIFSKKFLFSFYSEIDF